MIINNKQYDTKQKPLFNELKEGMILRYGKDYVKVTTVDGQLIEDKRIGWFFIQFLNHKDLNSPRRHGEKLYLVNDYEYDYEDFTLLNIIKTIRS